jgi:hypothetical protein
VSHFSLGLIVKFSAAGHREKQLRDGAGKAIPADGLSSIKRIGAKKISIFVFFPVAWLLLDAPLTGTATAV